MRVVRKPARKTALGTMARAFGVALAGAVSLAAVAAQAVEATAEQRRACTPDAFRLCASHIPNVEAITVCMRANKSKLSRDCRLVFDKPAKALKAVASNDQFDRDQ